MSNQERKRITITMDVTPAQEIAIKAMFSYWNSLSVNGLTRYVSFYVDGDGDFNPNVKVNNEEPEVRHDISELAITDEYGNRTYDYDYINWKINNYGGTR